MTRSRSKKKSPWLAFWALLTDERLSKIAAVLCFMAALFVLISCFSYFFTWRADQDKILSFSYRILFMPNLPIANWLGRLGALTAHFIFYYGFGLASLLWVPILLHLGFRFLHRNGWLSFLKFLTHALFLMAFLSMSLYYVFHSSPFPYGGAFGSKNTESIAEMMGPIGAGLALIFGLISLIVWYFNPSLKSLQVQTLGENSFDGLWRAEWFSFRADSPGEMEGCANAEYDGPESFLKTTAHPAADEPPIEIDWSESNPVESVLAPDDSDAPEKHSLVMDIVEARNSSPARAQIVSEQGHRTSAAIAEREQESWDGDLEPFDPKANLTHYKPPSLDLLCDYADQKFEIDRSELESNKNQIIATLQHYKIEIQKIKATIGPTVTLYEIVPAPGVRISRIKSLEDDIALSLSAQGIRIIAPIPGRGTIGIEVANKNKQVVPLKELLRSEKFNDPKLEIPILLGKNISNEVIVADLTKMPHLLIAGATGQGKSVGINSILMSILYRKHPAEVKLVLIDPKKVELPIYGEIEKHFLAKLPNSDEAIITDTSKVIYTLNSLCIEMDQRYELLKMARVRNLLEYNDKFTKRKLNPENGHRYLPYIVLVIDEFADLIMTAGKEVELPLGRLAQLARAIGIHLIIATQRPSVKIITGLIKANFSARIAYKVSSNIDSRTILDFGGAERLIGRGDMLFSTGSDVIRLQCAFVDTPEVERVIKHISTQQAYGSPYNLPEYKGEEGETPSDLFNMNELDEMFEEAARLVVNTQHGSTSMIQRRLKLGYNRAGRIMDQLETMGIVSPGEGSKPREVLVFNEIELDKILSRAKAGN